MTAFFKRLLFTLVLLGLVAGAWSLWSLHRSRHLPRVILLQLPVEGIDPSQSLGLGLLIKDQMEVASGATILVPPERPQESLLASLPNEDVVVKFQGQRVGDLLALRMEWIASKDLRAGKAWSVLETGPLPPQEAFARLKQRGPLPVLRPGAEQLLPHTPARFWDLAKAASIQEDSAASQNLTLLRELSVTESGSAAVWLTLGEYRYRMLWTQSVNTDMPQLEALGAFDKALHLIPGYPRAALLKGLLLTDVGNQREAIRSLAEAHTLRRGVPELYSGLAYAGRTCGLLEGASRAIAARDKLSEPFQLSMPWVADNTYLYAGQWGTFRATLGDRKDPFLYFYRGYLSILEGRQDLALPFFLAGAANRSTSLPFSDLCHIYAEGIQGHQDQALEDLKTFGTARGRLQIPDGELTFKVAEAYGFLGKRDESIETAGRAFAQGFGCLSWYERSPLLEVARRSPRWPSLRQHLQERHSAMERSFPPDVFD